MNDKNRRTLTGVLAAAFLILAAVSHVQHWGGANDMTTGVFSRTAILLSAVWFAWYDLLRLPKFLLFFAPVLIAAVIIRPKLAVYLLSLAVPIWVVLKTLQFFSTPISGGKK
ncbi:MAG: hypothetical protein LBQ54_05140 [Planctomycetaceae bacterium]|jgi:hypothetical protein|nr:hypothetical protein [Planctomycetaceae bacterium]